MDELYQRITKQIVQSGKRIREKSGKIQDIGVTKEYLTEEDIRIERELKQIVAEYDPHQAFYGEEENENFPDAEDVWVADPISGTRVFISGLPHYGIAITHLRNQKPQFSAVYDPSMDDLYTAQKGKGAYLNGQRISVSKESAKQPKILYNLSPYWKDAESSRKLFYELGDFELYRLMGSHAVIECLVASGKYDGVVSLTKDSFPYFASSLMIKEAGGVYTNLKGEANIKPSDRIFIGGNRETYQKLRPVVMKVLQ